MFIPFVLIVNTQNFKDKLTTFTLKNNNLINVKYAHTFTEMPHPFYQILLIHVTSSDKW